MFAEVDVDGNGLLDPEELTKLVQKLGLTLTPAQVPQVMALIDTDGSGEVDFEEFFEWWIVNKDKTNLGLGGFRGFFAKALGLDENGLGPVPVATPMPPVLVVAGPYSISVQVCSWLCRKALLSSTTLVSRPRGVLILIRAVATVAVLCCCSGECPYPAPTSRRPYRRPVVLARNR